MAIQAPHHEKPSQLSGAALQISKNLHAALLELISDLTDDPAKLRQFIYLAARQKLKQDAIQVGSVDPQSRLHNYMRLKEALEDAITYVESTVQATIDQNKSRIRPPIIPGTAPREYPFSQGWRPTEEDVNPSTSQPTLESPPTLRDNVLIVAPQPMTLVETTDARFERWLDHRIRLSLQTMDYVPKPQKEWSSFALALKIFFGTTIGLALVGSLMVWFYFSSWRLTHHEVAAAPIRNIPPPEPAAAGPSSSVVAAPAIVQPIVQPAKPEPKLPFPLPRLFGVYAVNDGKLVELEQLPIKVPIPRVQISAEITVPSRATISGQNLRFVVYRRDLVSSAPQTVSVRVVARVLRLMKFVGGKPTVSPIEFLLANSQYRL